MYANTASMETRFDLRFSILGIPVRVHVLFWIMTLLLGSSLNGAVEIFIWALAVFVSILIHEVGHALFFRIYGQTSRILLYIGGGLTIPEPVWWGGKWVNVSLTSMQEILVSLAGPLSGFAFAFIITALAQIFGGSVSLTLLFGFIPYLNVAIPTAGWTINYIIGTLIWINVFWGIINLLPIQPLDGGHVARNVLIESDPYDGLRKSLWVSVVAAGIVAVFGLIFMRSFFMALFFGALAGQAYMTLKGRSVIGM